MLKARNCLECGAEFPAVTCKKFCSDPCYRTARNRALLKPKAAAWRAVEAVADGQRICSACEQTKPATTEFFYLCNGALHRWCKECAKARVRQRWANDPDAAAKDKARRDQKREQIRVYDRMRAKRDREKKKVIIDRWHANNPERSRALAISRSATRRAREKNIGGKWTADDVDRMMRGQKGRCWWCSKKLGAFHVDHRIPVAKDGTNDPSNLVLSCPPCNRSKSAKLPQEFAGRLF